MTRRFLGWSALVGIIGLVAVAGCAPPPSTGGASSTSGSAASGKVTIWLQQKPDHMSPFMPATYGNAQILQATQDVLAIATSDGKINPRLASAWKLSADATTITVDLVDQKWSDGIPFTPEDVIFSFTRYADKAVKASNGARLSPIKGYDELASGATKELAGVTKTGDKQVTFTLKSPNSGFLAVLMSSAYYILPKHVLESIAPADLGSNELWKKPTVGLGPFTLVTYLPDQRVELKRNPNFRTPVKFQDLIMSAVAQDVATSQLASGEIDLSLVLLSDIKTVKGMSNVTITEYASPGFDRYSMNLSKDYLKDKRVRQAFMHALDRTGIIASVYGGQATVVNSSFVSPMVKTDGLNQYPRDVAKAKALLTEAGWDPNRELDLAQVNNNAFRASINEIIVKNLSEVGVKVKIRPIDQAQVSDTLKGNYDLFLYGGGNYVVDPSQNSVMLLCTQDFRAGKGGNLPGYCNATVDKDFADAAATGDQAKRAELYSDAAKYDNDEVSHLWIARPKVFYASSARLSGVRGSEAMSDALLFAQDWVLK